MKDRLRIIVNVEEVGDEYTIVQKHLRIFLDEIIEVADKIVCGNRSLHTASSSSLAKQQQSTLKIEREWKYRIDVMTNTAPASLAQPSIPAKVNSAGDVDGGFSDFSLVHKNYPFALCLFEAKKTQLDLSDLSESGAMKAIAQGGYQMLGDIVQL